MARQGLLRAAARLLEWAAAHKESLASHISSIVRSAITATLHLLVALGLHASGFDFVLATMMWANQALAMQAHASGLLLMQ